ncbi:hypothetical protein [Acidianus manzaensis]|uniref:Uncharacterized protein n=1 Tax=Acidianus manzaensis TaxID=282676 RepID=A0A1W6JYQ0_9CREN|nr:hypothetical protein [Acidianus manzaensis]ARM75340.1 hypothetical protein B6F84_04360 [Acidianus manzaensis]
MSNFNLPNFQAKKIEFEQISQEYIKIWSDANKRLNKEGVKALIYGSIGLYYRLKDLSEAVKLIKDVRKEGPQDLNVIVREKDREKFKEILMSMNFVPYYHLEITMGHIASIFLFNEFTIKVYYMDVARFNHDVEINWNEDFSMDLTDLLLTKLQVHYSTDKDAADIAAILLKGDQINKEKIGRSVSTDWGFWKDAVDNLNKAREYVSRLERDNPKNDGIRKVVSESLKLYGYINNYPKSESWKPLSEDEKYWRDF